MKILSITGTVLFEDETATAMRDLVERAVAARTNLTEAELSGADLYEAELSGANLYQAELCGANLTEAELSGANLCEANLCEANLYGANLCEANLSKANLTWANLTKSPIIDLGHDARGYRFLGVLRPDGGWWYRAGCRQWDSIEDALAHYGPTYTSDGNPTECTARLQLVRSLIEGKTP